MDKTRRKKRYPEHNDTSTTQPLHLPAHLPLSRSNTNLLPVPSLLEIAHQIHGPPLEHSPLNSPCYTIPIQNKENHIPAAALPITAPVPLSYAVRSKAALQSILSVGDEDSAPENESSIDKPNVDPEPHDNNAPNEQPTEPLHWQDQLQLAMTNNPTIPTPAPEAAPAAQPTTIIRPVSASTLFALTEPCLMRWCLDPDSEMLSAISPSEPVALPSIFAVPPSAGGGPAPPVNSWGY